MQTKPSGGFVITFVVAGDGTGSSDCEFRSV